jgi:hypothetical protein
MKLQKFLCLLPLLTTAFAQSNFVARMNAKGLPATFASAPASFPTGDLNFAPGVAYPSGGLYPASVVVADLNGDGVPDIVVANQCVLGNVCVNGELGVLLGKGDGTFRSPMTYSSAGDNTRTVAVADVNGDGKPDLVVTNSESSGLVAVLLGRGDGTFRPAVNYSSGGEFPFSVAVADVNGDGKPDLLLANDNYNTNGTVGVLLGNGDGTFQQAVAYNSGGYQAFSVTAADVNGDGKIDVVVANLCSDINCVNPSSVGVLLGNGNGTFQSAAAYSSGAYQAFSIAVADLNHDGNPDLVVANECGNIKCGQEGTVGVLLGKGNGNFHSVVSYASGGYSTSSLAVADVNGDGIPDLLTANHCSTKCTWNSGYPGSVGVLLGNGDGTFNAAVTFGSGGSQPYAVTAADVNGDGQPDLIVTNCSISGRCGSLSKGNVGVLINTSSPGRVN